VAMRIEEPGFARQAVRPLRLFWKEATTLTMPYVTPAECLVSAAMLK